MSEVGKKFLRWTPEKLRSYKGFECLTDLEAESAITTLERMARLLLSAYKQNYDNGSPPPPSRIRERNSQNQNV